MRTDRGDTPTYCACCEEPFGAQKPAGSGLYARGDRLKTYHLCVRCTMERELNWAAVTALAELHIRDAEAQS